MKVLYYKVSILTIKDSFNFDMTLISKMPFSESQEASEVHGYFLFYCYSITVDSISPR